MLYLHIGDNQIQDYFARKLLTERKCMARRKKINLTKGEEEVMLYLWQLGSGSIGQILELWPKPKPKYTTVATFMKLLEEKRCVAHSPLGKKYSFRPLIKKAHYADIIAERMLNNFFDG